MEILELARILRLLLVAAWAAALILSVAGLISPELRSVYRRLKRPMRYKMRLVPTQSGASTKH